MLRTPPVVVVLLVEAGDRVSTVSFGAAAVPGGFPRVLPVDPCPCGGGRFDGCCGPILAGDPAPTAERLMRSRYTAFVVGDEAYLRRTWHPRTRPIDLELDPATRWLGLEVLSVADGSLTDDTGTVDFVARSRHGGGRHELREHSRFVRRAARWVYVDGVIDDAQPGSAASVSS